MKPTKLTKAELRDMLANALSETQENKLISKGWRLTTNSWKESLNKLENLKPIISLEETMLKSMNKWKHFQETDQLEHGGGNLGKRKGGNRNGGGNKKYSRDDDNEDPRGNKNSPRRDCKNCDVNHEGCCNKPLGWINDPKNPRSKYNNKKRVVGETKIKIKM